MAAGAKTGERRLQHGWHLLQGRAEATSRRRPRLNEYCGPSLSVSFSPVEGIFL